MSSFIADLHIHSRFSRATSKKLTLPFLASWATIKGISVLGTGDITHPIWRQELHELLVYDQKTGLYQINSSVEAHQSLPDFPVEVFKRCKQEHPVYFMPQGEVSCIYKRGGKVRKVHHLIYFPTLTAADKFCQRLSKIGNLSADGRPIVGLDSEQILEMVLETDPLAFLVPAHIWTPWFSIFGAKSGFDSLDECFGSLASEVFALETGLSSDPPMIRLWSHLDHCKLVSNSDAHSGENLGREATCFTGETSYSGMLGALAKGSRSRHGSLHDLKTQYAGTIEFFPEEGKYYLDGHRKCHFFSTPEQTLSLQGRCPHCKQQLTIGVLNRIKMLADRKEPRYTTEDVFVSLVPLLEILGEVLQAGVKTKKVRSAYCAVLAAFGSELQVLRDVPVSKLMAFSPLLGIAIKNMRQGDVIRQSGYDGEYGKISMLSASKHDKIISDVQKTSFSSQSN